MKDNFYDIIPYGFNPCDGFYYEGLKHTRDPKEALKFWFDAQDEYPASVDICASTKDAARKLLDAFVENFEAIKAEHWTPYKWEYLLESAKGNDLNSFYECDYGGDVVFPFCKG